MQMFHSGLRCCIGCRACILGMSAILRIALPALLRMLLALASHSVPWFVALGWRRTRTTKDIQDIKEWVHEYSGWKEKCGRIRRGKRENVKKGCNLGRLKMEYVCEIWNRVRKYFKNELERKLEILLGNSIELILYFLLNSRFFHGKVKNFNRKLSKMYQFYCVKNFVLWRNLFHLKKICHY
jgi:hypothetical protein